MYLTTDLFYHKSKSSIFVEIIVFFNENFNRISYQI